MKKILPLLFLFLYQTGHAQADSIAAPYLRFPTFPPVKLLNDDSTTFFTKANLPKKTDVMLITFSPTCEHCQHEMEEIIKNMDQFKNIRIVMATMMPFDSMMSFKKHYELQKYPNISVHRDVQYFLPSFYMMHSLPFLAFYDKKGKLISVFEGSLPIDQVLAKFDDK
jgi:thioredoxin-related protein